MSTAQPSTTPVPDVGPGEGDSLGLTGKPDGGGLRVALQGLRAIQVPPVRSVLATAVVAVMALLLCGTLVTFLDVRLASLLNGSRLSLRNVAGLLAVFSFALGVLLAVRSPLALSGTAAPLGRRDRRRVTVALGLLVFAALTGLYWSSGASLS